MYLTKPYTYTGKYSQNLPQGRGKFQFPQGCEVLGKYVTYTMNVPNDEGDLVTKRTCKWFGEELAESEYTAEFLTEISESTS